MSRTFRQEHANPPNRALLFKARMRKYIERHDAVQPILDRIQSYFDLNKGKKLTRRMVPWMGQACPGYHIGWDDASGMIHLNIWNGTVVPADEPFHILIAYTESYGKPSEAESIDPANLPRLIACYRQSPEYRQNLLDSIYRCDEWVANYAYHLQEIKNVVKQAEAYGTHHTLTALFDKEFPL